MSEQVQTGPATTFQEPGNGPTVSGVPIQVTAFTYNTVNQIATWGGVPGSGLLPVRVVGSASEATNVTVNSQRARVFPDPSSTTGGQLFSATLSLAPGVGSNQVSAKGVGKNLGGGQNALSLHPAR